MALWKGVGRHVWRQVVCAVYLNPQSTQHDGRCEWVWHEFTDVFKESSQMSDMPFFFGPIVALNWPQNGSWTCRPTALVPPAGRSGLAAPVRRCSRWEAEGSRLPSRPSAAQSAGTAGGACPPPDCPPRSNALCPGQKRPSGSGAPGPAGKTRFMSIGTEGGGRFLRIDEHELGLMCCKTEVYLKGLF